MLNHIIESLNQDLSANDINLSIVHQNDLVAYGVVQKDNMFFSITIKEHLVKISEEFYNHQAEEIAYKEILSLTHQGQMAFVAKKIKTFF